MKARKLFGAVAGLTLALAAALPIMAGTATATTITTTTTPTTYTVTDLGSLGGCCITASLMNSSGQVVGTRDAVSPKWTRGKPAADNSRKCEGSLGSRGRGGMRC